MNTVRAWLTLGAVRTRLPLQAVTAQPGGSAGGGVPGCRRRSARGRLARIAGEAGQAAVPRIAAEPVAAARSVSAGRETGGRLVPVSTAVPRGRPGAGTRPGKFSRPGPAGTWCARSGETARAHETALASETALAGERTWTGKRATGRGASLTRECAIGGEVSLASERALGRIRVLRRAWSVTVRRGTVAWAAAGRPAGRGRPSWCMVFAALGRDDQTARCVNGRRGEDPLPVDVDDVSRPGRTGLEPSGRERP